jgi:hypothetical protein
MSLTFTTLVMRLVGEFFNGGLHRNEVLDINTISVLTAGKKIETPVRPQVYSVLQLIKLGNNCLNSIEDEQRLEFHSVNFNTVAEKSKSLLQRLGLDMNVVYDRR